VIEAGKQASKQNRAQQGDGQDRRNRVERRRGGEKVK
jgi:hypothetical protein